MVVVRLGGGYQINRKGGAGGGTAAGKRRAGGRTAAAVGCRGGGAAFAGAAADGGVREMTLSHWTDERIKRPPSSEKSGAHMKHGQMVRYWKGLINAGINHKSIISTGT